MNDYHRPSDLVVLEWIFLDLVKDILGIFDLQAVHFLHHIFLIKVTQLILHFEGTNIKVSFLIYIEAPSNI